MTRSRMLVFGAVLLATTPGRPCWAGQGAAAPDKETFARAARHSHGQPRTDLLAIESAIRVASPAAAPRIEAGLISVAANPAATIDARTWACRMLRHAGTERAVAALAPLLTVPQLAGEAAFALRSIGGPKVDAALRAALRTSAPATRLAVVNVIGARRDALAVPMLAANLRGADTGAAEATLEALGRIGGAAATSALEGYKAPAALQRARDEALIACADGFRSQGKLAAAASIYRRRLRSTDPVVWTAALRGSVVSDPKGSAPLLSQALSSADAKRQSVAAAALWELGADSAITQVLANADRWPAATSAIVLATATRPSALPLARRCVQSRAAAAILSAVAAIARLGGVDDTGLLLDVAATAGPAKRAAQDGLRALRGPGVSRALLGHVSSGPAARRSESIAALASRGAMDSVPTLLDIAGSADAAPRTAALHALGILISASDLGRLADLVAKAPDAARAEEVEDALGAALRRMPNADVAGQVVASRIASASPAARHVLLRVLAQAPSAVALTTIRAAAAGGESASIDTAVRLLAEWPTPEVVPDLQRIARSSTGPHKVLALRGLIHLVTQPGAVSAEACVAALTEALALAPTADEKRRVLGALPGLRSVAAMELAATSLSDPEVEVEAANTVVLLARRLQTTHGAASVAAVRKVKEACKSAEAKRLADNAGLDLVNTVNIAPLGTATSPDGIESDGAASGDQAAIDGNADTYWDEVDNQPEYRLLVTLPAEQRVCAISVLGHAHHNYSPKDFRVFADGREVAKVENAQYTDNFLVAPIPETTCSSIELRITGAHGASPAIRELGIHRRVARTEARYRVLVYSKTLGFRHTNIPLGAETIRILGAENGFDVDATEDSAAVNAATLAKYKAVVFLSVTGDVLNSEQETALKDYVLAGGGFAAIHGAIWGPGACEDQWAWYGEMLGGCFVNHSAIVPATVHVEERTSPSTSGLPETWQRTDEWYNFAANPRGKVRVLCTVDEKTYQGGTMGADHPISWCRQIGRGRVWYTAMGHTEQSFAEPNFLRHVLGGIQTVAAERPAEFAPSPAK